MTLADVPAWASVFVDANPFVYAFAPEPALGPPCFGGGHATARYRAACQQRRRLRWHSGNLAVRTGLIA